MILGCCVAWSWRSALLLDFPNVDAVRAMVPRVGLDDVTTPPRWACFTPIGLPVRWRCTQVQPTPGEKQGSKKGEKVHLAGRVMALSFFQAA